MILDGDILKYFDELGVDVIYKAKEEESYFSLVLSYQAFDMNATFTVNPGESSLTFSSSFEKPLNHDQMAEAMNVLNSESVLKAYYDRRTDSVILTAFSYVTEENVVSVIDRILKNLMEEDYEYVENLYNSIYRESYTSAFADTLEEDSDEDDLDDTTIEEDMAELMSLLGKL